MCVVGFLLPLCHQITTDFKPSHQDAPTALVLSPTRELATQIFKEGQRFSPDMKYAVIYGGVPKHTQVEELRKCPHIVVGTPGRLVDMLEMKKLDLSNLKVLVLDEADRMLDMGFEPQLKKIMDEVPKDHQTLFFTATWAKSVNKLAAKYLRKGSDLVRVTIGSGEDLVANKSISQEFYELDDSEKEAQLWKCIEKLESTSKMIVFANTKRRIDHLSKQYWADGFGASAIHGDKTQQERESSLAKFVAGEWPLMFATDVAARGLDIKGAREKLSTHTAQCVSRTVLMCVCLYVLLYCLHLPCCCGCDLLLCISLLLLRKPGVTHVLNFDMPRDVENYVHRIGRCGRAGATVPRPFFFLSLFPPLLFLLVTPILLVLYVHKSGPKILLHHTRAQDSIVMSHFSQHYIFSASSFTLAAHVAEPKFYTRIYSPPPPPPRLLMSTPNIVFYLAFSHLLVSFNLSIGNLDHVLEQGL